MTVMAMMQILFRMSLQGSIIIGIILLLRMVFRGLRIPVRRCGISYRSPPGVILMYRSFCIRHWYRELLRLRRS